MNNSMMQGGGQPGQMMMGQQQQPGGQMMMGQQQATGQQGARPGNREAIWEGELQWRENSKTDSASGEKTMNSVLCSVTSSKDNVTGTTEVIAGCCFVSCNVWLS